MNSDKTKFPLDDVEGQFVEMPSTCTFIRGTDSIEIGTPEVVDALQYFPICVRNVNGKC